MIILLFIFCSIVSNRLSSISSASLFHTILDVRKRVEVIDTKGTIPIINPISRENNTTVLYQPTQELNGVQSIMINTTQFKYNRFITLPTTPYKNYGNKEIEFYPWNDGIDYSEMCNKILKRITQKDTFYVISDSIPGGIGHKYTSLLHSLTYAILTGRRFIGRISLFD